MEAHDFIVPVQLLADQAALIDVELDGAFAQLLHELAIDAGVIGGRQWMRVDADRGDPGGDFFERILFTQLDRFVRSVLQLDSRLAGNAPLCTDGTGSAGSGTASSPMPPMLKSLPSI